MSFLLGNTAQNRTTRLSGMTLQSALLGKCVPALFGTRRISSNMIWYGGFTSSVAKQQGGSAGGVFGKGNQQFVYSASILSLLCQGPITAIGSVWDQNGQFQVAAQSETGAIPSSAPYNYQVQNNGYQSNGSSVFNADFGASYEYNYSYNINDFGNPNGPQTISGTDNMPLAPVSGSPLTGEYSLKNLQVSVTSVLKSGGDGIYSYSGANPGFTDGMQLNVTGCTSDGNNIYGAIAALGSGTFTLANPSAVTESESLAYALAQNVYVFNSAQAGLNFSVTYSYYRYRLVENELAVIPGTSPYEVVVQYGPEMTGDFGVKYYPGPGAPEGQTNVGEGFTKVDGSPGAPGQYQVVSCAGALYGRGKYVFYGGGGPGANSDAGLAVEITYSWQNQETDVNAPNQLNMTLISGAIGQDSWEYISSTYPGQALGYTGAALVGAQNLYLGQTPDVPNYSFEISGPFTFGAGYQDCNPADCIEAILTNPQYGIGRAADESDNGWESSWIDSSLSGIARTYWTANSFFISDFIDSQSTVASLISNWLEAGQVWCYWSEGKLKFTPLGDTTTVGNGALFVPPTNPVVSLDDSDYMSEAKDPIKVTRAPWQDAWNKVQVEWSVRENNYNKDVIPGQDDADILRYGLRLETPKAYDFICTAAAAQFAANLRVQRSTSIRNTYEFETKSIYPYLEPGDVIEVYDPALYGDSPYFYPVEPGLISRSSNTALSSSSVSSGSFFAQDGASLVVVIYNTHSSAAPPSSITDGFGNVYTQITAPSIGSAASVSVWLASDILGGSADVLGATEVTATWSGSQTSASIVVLQYGQLLDVDKIVFNSSATTTSSFSTTATNEVVVAIAALSSGTGTFSAGDIGGIPATLEATEASAVAVEDAVFDSIQSGITAAVTVTSSGTKNILAVSFESTSALNNTIPVRIKKIVDDPRRGISITAEDYPYSISSAVLYPKPSGSPTGDPTTSHQAPDNTALVVVEMPAAATLQQGNTVYIFACGEGSNWGGCDLYYSYDGVGYNWLTKITTPGRIGELTATLPAHTDPDTSSTLAVFMTSPDAQLLTVGDSQADALISLSAVIGVGQAIGGGGNPSSGTVGPTKGTAYTQSGSFYSWTNSQALLKSFSGSSYVTMGVDPYHNTSNPYSNLLTLSGVDFSAIPAAATITNIEVDINADYSNPTSDNSAQLEIVQLAGVTSPINVAPSYPSSDLTTSPATYTYSHAPSSWTAESITPAVLKASGFGLTIGTSQTNSYERGACTVNVYSATITVTYTNGGGGSPVQSSSGIELITYGTADFTGPQTYDLTYLRRGQYGTSIRSFAAGSLYVRLDEASYKTQYSQAYVGSTIYFKATSFNVYGQAEQTLPQVAALAVPLTGTPGAYDVGTGAITGFVSFPPQQPNQVFAGAPGGAAATDPYFRGLVQPDLPNIDCGSF